MPCHLTRPFYQSVLSCCLVAAIFLSNSEGCCARAVRGRRNSDSHAPAGATATVQKEDTSNETMAEMVAETIDLADKDFPEELLDEQGPGPEIAMLFLFISLLLGCATRFILAKIKSQWGFRIPYSVVLLTVGGVWGALGWHNILSAGGETNEMATISLSMWTHMSPRLILFIFLPALIFEGAMSTDYYVFRHQFPSGVMLAGPAMILQVVLIAMVGKYSFPYGWGWTESLLFGGILSATDPVAVIALMKELGLLGDLRVLIEAESLLNDGTAIVVFELCLMVLLEPSSVAEYVGTGFQLVFGAPALGIGLFLASWYWLQRTDDPIQDTMVTVCTAYLCYFLSEAAGCKVSGVLSVLTLGILMAGFGITAINTEHAQHMLHAVWTIIVWVCDTVVFILAGAIIVQDGFLENRGLFKSSDWGYLFALYISLILIRLFVVLLCSPFFRYSSYGMQERVCSMEKFVKYLVILSWGGLRGAVGLVLALIVSVNTHLAHVVGERDPHYCPRVLLHTGGIVVLTTLINAASLEKLIMWFGLAEPTDTEEQLKNSAKRFLIRKHSAIMVEFQNRQNYPDLSSVDWKAVQQIVGADTILHHLDPSHDENHGVNDPYASFHEAWRENDFLGRYLVSLRCSYCSQFASGLLSSLAYRQVMQALNTAIDHCNDLIRQERDKKFEWGWLIEAGHLELPWWLAKVHSLSQNAYWDLVCSAAWRSKCIQKWTRQEHARRMEIMLAVARAHEDTLRCEVYPDDAPACVDSVLKESQEIKAMAENQYAALQWLMPDISSAVRTRQTCQMVLTRFYEEVESLHSTAQITEAEYEQMEHYIFNQRLKLTHKLPPVASLFADADGNIATGNNELHYYFSAQDLQDLSSALQTETFQAGEEICNSGSPAEALYIIAEGMVRLHKETSNPKSRETDEIEHERKDVTSPINIAARHLTAAAASFVLQKPKEEDAPTLKFEMLMGAGCCVNDVEFLLHDSGFLSENLGRVVAVTQVRLFRLKFVELQSKPMQYRVFLEKMWRNSGHALCLRFPQHLDCVLPTDWSWHSTALENYTKGASVHLRYTALLVEGCVENMRDGRILQALTLLTRQSQLDEYVVKSESCKILLCPTCPVALLGRTSSDFSAFAAPHRSPKPSAAAGMSSVERRSIEFGRGAILGNRLLESSFQNYASNASVTRGSFELLRIPELEMSQRRSHGETSVAAMSTPLPNVRLGVLKGLLSEGLIGKEEYEEKRAKILESI